MPTLNHTGLAVVIGIVFSEIPKQQNYPKGESTRVFQTSGQRIKYAASILTNGWEQSQPEPGEWSIRELWVLDVRSHSLEKLDRILTGSGKIIGGIIEAAETFPLSNGLTRRDRCLPQWMRDHKLQLVDSETKHH